MALSLLSSIQFDIVISDLNLSGQLNGLDILGALKTLPRKIDAILITGTGSSDARRRAKSLGAVYMEKPVKLKELEEDDSAESKKKIARDNRQWPKYDWSCWVARSNLFRIEVVSGQLEEYRFDDFSYSPSIFRGFLNVRVLIT
jgi:DNA-binding NtrC family response regulator